MLPVGADDPREIGEFRLHALLGAGGMGRVYLASSPGGRAVAVKVVHAHLARDAAFRERFRQEVAAAQAVNAGYAAPVVAAGPDDDRPWLATAYVAGPSLQEAVAETGPLPVDAVLKLAAGLAEALHAIHDGGVVHRDLKPDNVLLADDGPRVIDFGIARALDGTRLTSAGSVVGTPSFMSPEQAQGQPTGPASDVFSLGGVVYFAATGTGPFGSGNSNVLLYRIVHTEPDLDRLPRELRDLAAACLAKDPALRPTPAGLTASLMGALPPEGSLPAFWPAPVARLIADHQAQFAARLMASEPVSAQALTMPVAPAAPLLPMPPVTPPLPATPGQKGGTPPLPADPATPPLPAAGPTPAGAGRPAPIAGMGRRRALAALAGAATAGLVVAGWELTRPGPAAAGNLVTQGHTISARPGTKVWSYETNGAVASILVNDGVVYAGTLQRAVYALDALTGKLLWRHLMGTGKTYNLVTASDVVIAAMGYNGVAPTGYTGGVYALDSGTGKLRWSVVTGPVIGLAVSGDVVYAGSAIKSNTTMGVTALSADTGELLWTFDFATQVDLVGGVVAADGVVYVNSSHGEIIALDAKTGNVIWQTADPTITFSNGLVLANGVLYATSGHDKQDNNNPVLYAIDPHTGHQRWQHPLGVSPYSAAVDVKGDVVFTAVSREANLSSSNLGASDLMALNTAAGQVLWNVPVAGVIFWLGDGPGNVIYSGNGRGVLDAWQADTGNHLWSYRAAGMLNSDVVVYRGAAYFGGTDRRVYAVAVQS